MIRIYVLLIRLFSRNAGWCGLTIFLFASCVYSPTDTFFKEVAKPSGAEVVIKLNPTTQTDTLLITRNTVVNFNISTKSSNLKVSVLLGNTIVYSTQSNQGSFLIEYSPSLYGTVANLNIQVTSTSTNGSLASTLNSESVQTWGNWVIYYFKPPPAPILSTSISNGFLKLSWSQLPPLYKKYFKNYTINSPNQRQIVITNPNTSSFLDSAYLEGMFRSYTVTLNTISNSVVSNPLIKAENLITRASIRQQDSLVTIRWSKTKYPSALDKIHIQMDGQYLALAGVNSDTTLTRKGNLLFGQNTMIELTYTLKYPYLSNTASRAFANVRNPLAQGFIYFGQNLYNSNDATWLFAANLSYSQVTDEFIINANSGPLRFLNLSTGRKDSININRSNLHVPFPGKFIYNSNIQFDIVKRTSVNLPVAPIDFIKGANNQYITTAFNIFDMASNTVVMPLSARVSNDGKYGLYSNFFGTTVYTLNGNPYNSQASIPNGYYNLQFRPDDCSEIYNESSKISILSSTNGSLKREFLIPSDFAVYNYDPMTKNFLICNSQSSTFFLVHIETGIRRQLNGKNCTVLLNGYLFSRDGGYVKLL